jgi:hypothetical protein
VLCSAQRAEHIVDGVVVKINKAGPRPEYEQPPPDVKPLMPVRARQKPKPHGAAHAS